MGVDGTGVKKIWVFFVILCCFMHFFVAYIVFFCPYIPLGIRVLLTAQASTGESYAGNRPIFGPSGRGHCDYCYFGAPPPPRGILAKSPAGRLSPDSLPREPILGSIKSGLLCRNGPPKKRIPKSKIKSRIISLGGISLPREPILDSVIVWACSACSACSA